MAHKHIIIIRLRTQVTNTSTTTNYSNVCCSTTCHRQHWP